ncbi:hypothetical protein [Hyphomicrobium sp.]|uniref:hypothetical protein n=1 Tax=Hyphomicrobium sp. TaxID=82 RepID=UPI003F72B837
MAVEQTRPPRRIIGQLAPPPGGHTELNPLTIDAGFAQAASPLDPDVHNKSMS